MQGMRVYVRSADQFATYRAFAWELGALRGSSLIVGGQQVVGSRAAPITSPAGGSTVDMEGRASIAAILTVLREHGLIAT
jgi:hypothetical protein